MSTRGTLRPPEWKNSTVLGPYDADALDCLKRQVDGDMYVNGSGILVRGLLADGLVDELLRHLPVAVGAGRRLFAECRTAKLALRPTCTTTGSYIWPTDRPSRSRSCAPSGGFGS
jgi:dihydrofolate reductase